MRRFIISILTLTCLGGVASADRYDRADRRPGGVVVRDRDYRDNHRYNQRYNDRRYREPRRVRVVRRPVYVNNNRFVFDGGYTRAYSRPVLKYRYYNYRVRPQILVENYDPVPGYIWVAGQWSWNGYEWQWQSGHYAPDPSYTQQDYGYDYDGDGYADGYQPGYPQGYPQGYPNGY